MISIGVVGASAPDLFAWHILETLPSLGVHSVSLGTPFPSLPKNRLAKAVSLALRTPQGDALGAKRIVRRALESGVNVVITVGDNLTPPAVSELRKNGVQVVLWHPDATSNWGRMWFAVSDYTCVFLKDPIAVDRLRSVQGLPVEYLPEACNPAVHRPLGSGPMGGSVVLAGNYYGSRVGLLNRLQSDSIPLDLFGYPVPRWMPEVSFAAQHRDRSIVMDEKARQFRGAGCVLNNLHPAEGGMNCRLFEAAACGAAVVTEYRPPLPDLFSPGQEVLSFSSYEELLRVIRRCLDDPLEATRMGDAAASRAHAEHTYAHRLTRILEQVL